MKNSQITENNLIYVKKKLKLIVNEIIGTKRY